MGRVHPGVLVTAALLAAVIGCGSSGADGNSGNDAGGAGSAHAGRGATESGGASGAAGGGAAASGTTGGGAAGASASGGTAGSDAETGQGGVGAGGAADDGSGGVAGASDAGGSGGVAGAGGVAAGATHAGSGGGSAVDEITQNVAIVPNNQGLVSPASNGIGIQGGWFADNDCRTSPGDCTTNHLIGPTGSEVPSDTRPFPSAVGEVCMRGETASVNSNAEFGAKWGVRWVLPLNEGPNGELRPYDAVARGIGAFAVEVRLRGPSMVNASLRVALLVDGVEDTHSREYYGLISSDVFVAEFKRVKQGNGAAPFRVFDGSRITAIEITLPTRMGLALPFDLCVTRVIAMPASALEPDLSAAPQPPTGTHLVPLTLNADGSVQPNAVGIVGGWFAENDCATSPADCTADHSPAPGDPFPSTDNRACTTGVVDPVGASSEYATKWGAAIGLHLNRPSSTEPPAVYDASAHGVVGFAYKVRTYNYEPLRVEAVSQGVAEPHLYEFNQAVVQAMPFTGLGQGSWVTARTPLDPTRLLALRFHVPSASGVVRPFDFCVEELSAIVRD